MLNDLDAQTCLIIGAGMAGLTAATTLHSAGWNVTVVDKGRGVGGRMATRRAGDSRFDHGAQFITVRDDRFAAAIRDWESAGVVCPWFTEDGHTRYRGTEGMAGIAKHMARELNVRTEVRIKHLEACEERWVAESESGETFEAAVVVMTPPAEQSLALCEPFRPLLGRKICRVLQSIHFDPCYALMIQAEGISAIPAPGYIRPESGPVAWIADNVQKGISQGVTALTIHADPRFTIAEWDTAPADVAAHLLKSAEAFVPGPVISWQLQRWRYSSPVNTHEERYLASRCPLPVFFAGDAFGGPRVEGAFLSGLQAAETILNGEY